MVQGASVAGIAAQDTGWRVTWEAQEIARKLRQIERLSAGELVGWHGYCTSQREPFAGELAALQSRSRSLGMAWPPSSPDGPRGSTITSGPG